MKPEELAALSTEEINKKIRSTQTLTYTLLGILIAGLIFSIYTTVRSKEFQPIMITFFALFGVLPSQMSKSKQLRTELAKREDPSEPQ